MSTRKPSIPVRPEPLDAQLTDLLETVLRCERFERKHPLTVGFVRSLAPRVRKDR